MSEKIFNRNFIRIFITTVLVMTGNQIIMVVLPLYLDFLGKDPSVLGTATSLSALAAMLMRPFGGILTDRWSKKMVLILGAFIMILGMIGINMIPITFAIIAIRLIQGFGISGATTAQMAIAADVLPKSKLKRGMSYFGITSVLAAAFGPVIGIELIVGDNYTWSWMGAVLIFGMAILIVSTISYKIEEESPIRTGDKNYEGSLFWRFYEKKAFLPSLVQLIIMTGNAMIVFLPSYGRLIGIDNVGLFYTIQAITMFVANLLVGQVIDRVNNPLKLLIPGLSIFTLALFLLFMAQGPGLFFLAAVLYGTGFGTNMATMNVVIMSFAPYDRRGAASSTFLSSIDLGFSIGSLIGGIIIGSFGYKTFYGISVLFPLVAIFLSIIVFRHVHLGDREEPV